MTPDGPCKVPNHFGHKWSECSLIPKSSNFGTYRGGCGGGQGEEELGTTMAAEALVGLVAAVLAVLDMIIVVAAAETTIKAVVVDPIHFTFNIGMTEDPVEMKSGRTLITFTWGCMVFGIRLALVLLMTKIIMANTSNAGDTPKI